MRILFTGGSSFTGLWFARELVRGGHDVVATFTRESAEDYDGLRRRRVALLLDSGIRAEFSCRFGSDRFIDLVNAEGFDILCHHGADVTDYKSPEFNASRAVDSNTFRVRNVLAALQARRDAEVILTGTYFEAREGAGTAPLRAFSPYAESKTDTWEIFLDECNARAMPIGKFVIPNPIGEWEEPRLPAYLITSWLRHQTPVINTPRYVRDNIPVPLLADTYNRFVSSRRHAPRAPTHCSPSGWVESVSAFATRLASEMAPRLGVPCEFEQREQSEFPEPLERRNHLDVISAWPAEEVSMFWDDYARFYLSLAQQTPPA